jgi:hypothetical protein
MNDDIESLEVVSFVCLVGVLLREERGKKDIYIHNEQALIVKGIQGTNISLCFLFSFSAFSDCDIH